MIASGARKSSPAQPLSTTTPSPAIAKATLSAAGSTQVSGALIGRTTAPRSPQSATVRVSSRRVPTAAMIITSPATKVSTRVLRVFTP